MAVTAATFIVTNRSSNEIAFPGVKIPPGGSATFNHLTPSIARAVDSGYVSVRSSASLTDLNLSALDYTALASYTAAAMVNNATTFTTGELRTNFAILAIRLANLENLVKADIQNRVIPAR